MAKVIFSVPPVISSKGQAQATQNRQYQYFKDETYIFPVIPATFITMVSTEPGHEVMLVDAIAEQLNDLDYANLIVQIKPDYIIFEANTMVFKRYCEVINGIKENLPNIKIIFCGEHPTAMPQEAKDKSKADYILHGGKWYFEAFKIVTGKEWGDRPLPLINRQLSRWWLYAYKNGNFKYVPATYTMASQDCWYRPKQPCTFCSWVPYHENTTTRSVANFVEEVEGLVNFGFKEFFDDSGTFPVGKWLREFCDIMINRKYDVQGKQVSMNKLIAWGCNMRFGALQPEDFKLMADAGCRFILWGFESANQKTLDMLSKGYKVEDMRKDLIISRMAGIWNHLTVMQGYPWETLEEENRTVKMVKWLLVNDWASSAQSTICMPYPGTRLFEQCKENGWLINENWEEWDMSMPVMKLQYDPKEALKSQKAIYDTSYNPRFIWNKLSKIRTLDDIKFYYRTGKKVVNRFGKL